MKATAQYLDLAKKNAGIETDGQLARRLGVDRRVISNYRGGRPFTDEMVFKIAELAGVNPAEIIAATHAEREKDKEKRRWWRQAFEKVHGTAAAFPLALIMLLVMLPSPGAEATGFNISNAARTSLNGNIHYAHRVLLALFFSLFGPVVRLGARLPGKMSALILLGLCSQSVAQADTWSRDDTTREAIYLTLHVVDWGQTRDIIQRDDISETNPILGKNPTSSEVNRYFIAAGLLHAGVSYALPSRYRRYWQYLSITVQAAVVGRNAKLGLNVKF